jgi:hypothetical protein
MHDEGTLPKWARERLAALRLEVEEQRRTIGRLERAHEVLFGREWFTIPGGLTPGGAHRTLWFLDSNQPISVCSIGTCDVLLVGRATKERQP